MLVLTRLIGQSIIIDNDIVVRILNFNGDQVKLGITAPDDISVHREEIWWRIHNENKNNKYSNYDPNNPEGRTLFVNDTYSEEDKFSLCNEDDEDKYDEHEFSPGSLEEHEIELPFSEKEVEMMRAQNKARKRMERMEENNEHSS